MSWLWDGPGNLPAGSNPALDRTLAGMLLTRLRRLAAVTALVALVSAGPASAQVQVRDVGGFQNWAEMAHANVTFTASGSMTWTVELADLFNYIYSCSGGTCVLSFIFNSTSPGGTPSNELRFSLPTGIVPVKVFNNVIRYDVAGTSTVGYATVNPSWSYVRLVKIDGTTTWANGTNNTSITGQITFAVR
jgi:hypothetical protein